MESSACSVLEHLLGFLRYLVYSPNTRVVMIYIICLSRLLGSGINTLVTWLEYIRNTMQPVHSSILMLFSYILAMLNSSRACTVSSRAEDTTSGEKDSTE